MTTLQTQHDFRSKYTQTNFLSRWMLQGYFRSIAKLTSGLEIVSALEAGCGEGFSTQQIRSILLGSVSMEASDVEARLVEAAAMANPDVSVRQESVYQIPRADHSVDLIFLLEVLEHLEDPAAAMAEICRVSNRYIIVSVPREPLWCMLNLARLKYAGSLGNTPGHIRHWSASKFEKFIGTYAQVRAVLHPLPWTMILAEVR